jgi:hypothetical protein
MDDSEDDRIKPMKQFGNFLIGAALSGFGLIIVGRILLGVEIHRKDMNNKDLALAAFIEYLVVMGALLAMMFTVPACLLGVEYTSGMVAWTIGIMLMIPIGYAYQKKRLCNSA